MSPKMCRLADTKCSASAARPDGPVACLQGDYDCAMCAIFAVTDGKPVEMDERRYDKERDLQEYLASNPELLSAEVEQDERRRWLLVKREMGVPSREEGSNRFSLDHLFVDQDAIPTFVEVKRSTNTEIRRKIVGQMLDYAANASAHWDAGQLRSSFESRFANAEAAADELSAFLDEDGDAEGFWDEVAANLEERQLRLIFVADRIPRELRSIVEFLNEQLNQTQVIAVEVRRYVEPGTGRISLAPRIIGETEVARRVKSAGGGARRHRWTEEQFYAQMEEAFEPELAERMIALYEHAMANGSRRTFGHGKRASATVWMGEDQDPAVANPLALRFGTSGPSFLMRSFRSRRGTEEMERLVSLLRRLPGTSAPLDAIVAKDYNSFCHLPADEVLATDEDLEEFKRILDQARVREAAIS